MTTDIEGAVFDGLDLNALTTVGPHLELEGPSLALPAAQPRLNWITGADVDGAALAGDEDHYDNVEQELKVRACGCTTIQEAFDLFGQITDRVRRARQTPGGLPFVWTPHNESLPMTRWVIGGQVVDMPIDFETGYLSDTPVATFKLYCRPLGDLPDIVIQEVTQAAGSPFVLLNIPDVPGDVRALGRLIVTDGSARARRTVLWGMDRTTDALFIDSDAMQTTGFAGAQSSISGARDANAAGNSVIQATLRTEWAGVCGTGAQPHVGRFRVLARIRASSTQVRVRFAWQTGDGPFTRAPATTLPTTDAFCLVDLGPVRIAKAALGVQRWNGQIEACSSRNDGTQDTFYVDDITLVPFTDGYGKARADAQPQPGLTTASDKFSGTTAGDPLNGRTPEFGAAWVTSGAATDFTFADLGSEEVVSRSTKADSGARQALLGADQTDIEVGTRVRFEQDSIVLPIGQGLDAGVIARRGAGFGVTLTLSTSTQGRWLLMLGASNAVKQVSIVGDRWYRLVLTVYASGRAIGRLLTDEGDLIETVDATLASLATGGSSASGKGGLNDHCNAAALTSPARYYDDVYVATPAPDQIVLNSGRKMEFRHDGVIREDQTGTVWGAPPTYRGSRFMVPPAGDTAQTARVLVLATSNDIDQAAHDPAGEPVKVSAIITPRSLAFPRS